MDSLAHFPLSVLLRNPLSLPEKSGRKFHRIHDLFISGAAADVIFKCESNLLPRRIQIYIQETLGADDHSRNTKTALDGPRLPECIDENLFFLLRNTFHREDLFAVHL